MKTGLFKWIDRIIIPSIYLYMTCIWIILSTLHAKYQSWKTWNIIGEMTGVETKISTVSHIELISLLSLLLFSTITIFSYIRRHNRRGVIVSRVMDAFIYPLCIWCFIIILSSSDLGVGLYIAMVYLWFGISMFLFEKIESKSTSPESNPEGFSRVNDVHPVALT